jgi:hypothetical protein
MEQRQEVGHHFDFKGKLRGDRLFTFALLLIGCMLLGNYISAPEAHIVRPVYGFRIETNSTMIQLGKFVMTLDVESSVLSLYGEWQYVNAARDIGRTFNIVVVLPFLVQTYHSVQFFAPSIDNWRVMNTNATDVAASAVSGKFLNNLKESGFFYSEWVVAKTYVNAYRGSYTIVLPLDAGIDGAYFPNLRSFEHEAAVFCCTSLTETDVYLIFPESAIAIQPFPSAKVGFFSRYYDNATLHSVEWVMKDQTQVTLSFVDQNQQSFYEVNVILGSLLVGAGISGFADCLKERSANHHTRVRRN